MLVAAPGSQFPQQVVRRAHPTVPLATKAPMKKKGPSKEATALLPPFPVLTLPQVVLPVSEAECAAAAAEILAAGAAGFDTEARPTFRVGEVSDGPHVVQFAIADKAFVFQTRHAASHASLVALLESPALLKAGFGLKSDHSQLRRKFGVTLANVLDLDSVFRKQGYSGDMGVRAAVGLLLGQRFHKSKSLTTSNWALAELSAPQVLYAANDAWAAFCVLEALRRTHPELHA